MLGYDLEVRIGLTPPDRAMGRVDIPWHRIVWIVGIAVIGVLLVYKLLPQLQIQTPSPEVSGVRTKAEAVKTSPVQQVAVGRGETIPGNGAGRDSTERTPGDLKSRSNVKCPA